MCEDWCQIWILTRRDLAGGIVVRNNRVLVTGLGMDFNTGLLVKTGMWAVSACEAHRLGLTRATIHR